MSASITGFGSVFCLGMLLAGACAAAERHALLIGISDYRSDSIRRLEGPAHDLVSLKRALVRYWDFDTSRMATLLNAEASRARVQEALSALSDAARPGDYVLFYYSGHGTSAHDPERLWPMPYGTAALVPHDAELKPDGTLDRVLFSRTDIRPVFEALDRRGVTVLAIFDTCFSEHATRDMRDASYRVVRRRSSANATGRSTGTRSMVRDAKPLAPSMEPYPYENVFMVSAAAEDERALDIDHKVMSAYPTLDGMPHGALTDSVLRVLVGKYAADADADGSTSHRELFDAVSAHMSSRDYAQHPRAYPEMQLRDRLGETRLFASGTP